MIKPSTPLAGSLLVCLPLMLALPVRAQSSAAADAPPPPAAQENSAATDGPAATMKRVNGQVLARSATGERPLASGDQVHRTERILTGKDGSASLVLRDGTTLVLGPDCAVDLREFRFNPTTQEGSLWLSVVKGTLRMITGLIGKTRPESVRITTPTSTIGVLGTDFIVDVGTEGQP